MHLPDGRSKLHSLETILLTASAVIAGVLLVRFNTMHADEASRLKSINRAGTSARVSQTDGPYSPMQIDIFPPMPTSSDLVTITSSGEWHNSCTPAYQSHRVIGNMITIYAEAEEPGDVCLQVFTPWEFSVEVGPLPADTYTAEVYVTRWSGSPILVDRTSFVVVPSSVSVLISADGGELVHHYTGHTTSLTVPRGALSASSVFTISYHTPAHVGELQGMNHFFDLTGTQTIFTTPLTLTVSYSENLRGPIISGTENLYQWQNSQWVTDDITLTSRWSNGLAAQITHLSLFGVLGESSRTYLSIVLKEGD